MALSIGIVGLPNVGKSTLFNALTRNSVLVANYPFATIDPSVGVVAVPDVRLQKLTELSKSVKTIPAAIEFVDIAGLVKGASKGEGLGNQFLANIRECDAIAQVVRIFEDTDIHHVAGAIDPLADIEVITLELILADMETVSKHITRIEREYKRGDKEAIKEHDVLVGAKQILESGFALYEKGITDNDPLVKHLHLLTAKPTLFVLNKKAGGHNLDEMNDERYHALIAALEHKGAHYVIVDANIEQELSLVSNDDVVMFREEFGVLDDGISDLIQGGYKLLDLISFFTTGETETRAWQIPRNASAPRAGAAIHTDFQTKFIRAEVVAYERLMEAGSYAAAREKGWVRTEGKEYIVQDGDVIEFKI